MKTVKLFLFFAPVLFSCAGLHAQVTMGGLTEPATGALLDLNSPTGNRGGLLLSNVAITDLDSIPAGNDIFPGVSPDSLDINRGLRGALVYNTHPATVPGIYVWTGKRWMPAGETLQEDQILFTIHTEDGSYAIPTSGCLNFDPHSYDWDITVDGLPTTAATCPGGRCTGSTNSAGIQLSGLSTDKDHQIRIIPHGDEDPGWGNAFGYSNGTGGADAAVNKNKLISIDAPLSTLAFAPETKSTLAGNMFGFLFFGCSNLTTPAVIRDNYKLPETIIDLSYFLFSTYENTGLTQPVDLTLLKDWFNGNNTIRNLAGFFYRTHANNFNLTKPIDLMPLKDWFNSNSTITDVSYFLGYTHFSNTSLEQPIDFTPLKNWFDSNNMINYSLAFLMQTHFGNNSLTLSGQVIFPNWVKKIKHGGTTSLLDVASSFQQTFSVYVNMLKDGDTGEPRFENGEVLSSWGNPSIPKSTYTGRTDITNLNIGSNWK
jgi:hypothetical protein